MSSSKIKTKSYYPGVNWHFGFWLVGIRIFQNRFFEFPPSPYFGFFRFAQMTECVFQDKQIQEMKDLLKKKEEDMKSMEDRYKK